MGRNVGYFAPGFNANKFKKDLERFALDVKHDLPRAVDEASHALADEIRRRCPVDTGVTLATVEVKHVRIDATTITQVVDVGEDPADGRWRVGFLEYGTRDRPAQPFIRPAIAAKEAEMIRTIERALPDG